MTERLPSIARVVHNQAPEECPDRIWVKNLGININFHNYLAYLEEDETVACLGQDYAACKPCPLRIPSVSITLNLSRRSLELPAGTHTIRLKPNEVTVEENPIDAKD